jgi:Ca2+-binding EF-hand superfamily protein
MRRLAGLLRPFFSKYDADGSGNLSLEELSSVFNDLHDHFKQKDLLEHFKVSFICSSRQREE